MAKLTPIFSAISLLLLAGGILFQFFVILSGAISGDPIDRVYFLEAEIGNIPYRVQPVRWTYFALCGAQNGRNVDCGAPVPAFPFQPTDNSNFGTDQGVPQNFLNTDQFWYMSRFAWVFYLIALFFAVCALALGFIALCTRIGAFLSAIATAAALLFQAAAAALMTAWTVEARDVWNSSGTGTSATLGRWGYGWTWGAVAAFLFSMILFCVGGVLGRKESSSAYKRDGGFFGRKRSTRSRGSFIDSESQHRVKDEYA